METAKLRNLEFIAGMLYGMHKVRILFSLKKKDITAKIQSGFFFKQDKTRKHFIVIFDFRFTLYELFS